MSCPVARLARCADGEWRVAGSLAYTARVMAQRSSTLLSYAFRPFFLANAGFAMLVIPAWAAAWLGVAPFAGSRLDPLWHAHEMLFGFVPAAIAGFALTAVATWTGRPPLSGRRLAWLPAIWLAGRLATALAPQWPAWLVGSLSAGFIIAVALVLLRELMAAGNRRNYPVAGLILVVGLLDLLYHAGAAGGRVAEQRIAIIGALHLVLLLITLIGGRIIPAFTRNWLNARGLGPVPRSHRWLEAGLFGVTATAGIAHALGPAPLAGSLALFAAVLHAWRLAGWRGLATRSEPLLFVLHAAYACLPPGYALLGLGLLGILPLSAGLHVLGIGAIAGMILAVTTRVALGHTGRPLAAAPLTVAAYLALAVALLLRLVAVWLSATSSVWLALSAAAWASAFLLFLIVYTPILSGPART